MAALSMHMVRRLAASLAAAWDSLLWAASYFWMASRNFPALCKSLPSFFSFVAAATSGVALLVAPLLGAAGAAGPPKPPPAPIAMACCCMRARWSAGMFSYILRMFSICSGLMLAIIC